MRWLYGLMLTGAGWALVAAAEWAWRGAPGLRLPLPGWAWSALPLALFLLLGLYLGVVTGLRTARGLMVFQALAALAVAALPFAYRFGLAQRYGLPSGGGALGTLLAEPLARCAAAVWLALAVVAACRRPVRAAPSTPAGARVAHADVPLPSYWAPAPVTDPGSAAPPAFSPPAYAPPAGAQQAEMEQG